MGGGAFLFRVGDAHGRVAVPAADHLFQQAGHFRPRAIGACAAVLAQDGVDLVPGVLADNRRVLTRVDIPLVLDLPKIQPVVEQLVDMPFVPW